jgi:hypothetical protein
MPVSIRYEAFISLNNGKATWHVKAKDITHIQGVDVIALRTESYSFVKLVTEGILPKVPKNLTLANCDGVKLLQQLRNEAQCHALRCEEVATPARKLFGTTPAVKATRRLALEQRRVTQKRDGDTLIDVCVPMVGELDTQTIKMASPLKSTEYIRVDIESLEHVLLFIRAHGLNFDEKRAYMQSGEVGVWVHKGRKRPYYSASNREGVASKYKYAPDPESLTRSTMYNESRECDAGGDDLQEDGASVFGAADDSDAEGSDAHVHG